MEAILLDGSHAHDHTGERVRAALTAQLQARGWDVEHVVLREKKIGNCAIFWLWVGWTRSTRKPKRCSGISLSATRSTSTPRRTSVVWS